jgi:putative ATP-binding cassette transporter
MTLWRYLAAETAVSKLRLLSFLALSGVTNSLLMVIINYAAQDAAKDGAGSRLILLFAVALFLYLASQKFILRVAAYEVEHIVERLRVRLASVIRHADLLPVEHVGASRIFAGITKETLTLSQSALPMMIACQSAVMVLVSIVFIAIISPVALVMVLVIIGMGVLVHLRNIESGKQDLQAAFAMENNLFDALTDLLQGMKEVRLNESRNEALFQEIRRVAASVADRKTSAGMQFAGQYMFSQALFYLLMAALVFVLPRLASTEGATISIISGAILFIIGPLSSLVAAIPIFSGATVALNNIMQLEAELMRYHEEARPPEPLMVERMRAFESIAFRQIEFLHKDSRGDTTFRMGPLDLAIGRGETVFLVGGNGSGKSTLLKVITALYRPGGGRILVDGQVLTKEEYPAYRSCFSAIFSDYHLFSRMYGLEKVPEERVQKLLELMRLEEKTAFRNGRFETQELSTGQRKRLAMIVALLEDRPFYILDEWAADQDPEFREFFYKQLLVQLKNEGKTLLLATHDDRYFHLADRIYRMENGQLSPLTVAREPGA